MKFPFFSLKEYSLTVRMLSVSDAAMTAALGLFGPIFAIYLTEQIQTGNALEVIGVGTSIYLFTRSLGQVPLAYLIDKIPGERDDFYILLVGSLIGVVIPLLYILVTQPWHLFVIQFLFGVAGALTYPTWSAIFTRHIDKGKEGMEWGLYQTMSDVAGAVAAPVGAVIVSLYGFSIVLIFASALAAVSTLFVILIRNDLR